MIGIFYYVMNKERVGFNYDLRNISIIICDTDIP